MPVCHYFAPRGCAFASALSLIDGRAIIPQADTSRRLQQLLPAYAKKNERTDLVDVVESWVVEIVTNAGSE